jgi:pilus assembly protein CpaE
MSSLISETGSISMGAMLSVVLIEPQDERRSAMSALFSGPQSRVSREFAYYPGVDELSQVLTDDHDVVFVDLDSDHEKAIDVIETVCESNGAITVIVYSARTDSEILVRCMRAGAREFLSEPVLPGSITEALVRASLRRDEVRRVRKALCKLFVFIGAKGGSGATTVASNFALSLTREGRGNVVLLDLDLHLGDAALALGITSKFSTVDALENVNRLDSEFLSVMLTKHDSGLLVLPAPDKVVSDTHTLSGGIERLVRISRENFSYVVVDAGTKPSSAWENLFESATAIYLVSQLSVPELRNANRLITRYLSGANQNKAEIVLNRVASRGIEIDDAGITRALTRPAKWKLPNDYASARRAQNTAIPLVMEDSPLARSIRKMASIASGHIESQERKKRF